MSETPNQSDNPAAPNQSSQRPAEESQTRQTQIAAPGGQGSPDAAEVKKDGGSTTSKTVPTPSVGIYLNIALLIALLAFVADITWDYFKTGLLPLALVAAFVVLDVVIFQFKLATVAAEHQARARSFSPNLRLIAFGALLGLIVIGLKWTHDAFELEVGDGAWAEWRWVLRLLIAVLFTGLVALGIGRLAKED